MKNIIQNILIISIISGFNVSSFSQDDNEAFIQDNAIYKPNSNWVTLAVGYGYNPFIKVDELAGSIVFHASFNKINLMAGYYLFTDESFTSRSKHSMTNFNFGAGYRKETLKTNFAAFAGPLYAFGNKKIHDTQYYRFQGPGFFIEAEYTYKIYYDIGIGISAFYNFSSYYQVVGLKLLVYFSGAFKTGLNQPKIN